MDVRCAGCNKLFRVSDEKIIGSGIKFSCTRCHETVTITKADFEQYKLSKEAALLPSSATPKPSKAAAPPPPAAVPETTPPPEFLSSSDDASSMFDLSDPATAAAAMSQQMQDEREGEIPGLFSETTSQTEPGPAAVEAAEPPAKKPEPKPVAVAPVPAKPAAKPVAKPEPVVPKVEPKPQTKVEQAPPIKTEPKPALKPKPATSPKIEPKPAAASKVEPKPAAALAPAAGRKIETKPATPLKEEGKAVPRPKAEPVRATAAAGESAVPAMPVEIPEETPPAVFDAAPQAASSGFGKKAMIAVVVLLLAGAAVYGIVSFRDKEAGQAPQTVSGMLSPEGLQVLSPSGSFDSARGDLIITGTVENTTDKPKPAWYVVVEVYDAQNNVIARARLLSGKQLYTKRDLEILLKRGANVQDLKMKSLEQGTTIPPKGSMNFEIRILEAPVGVASFNPVLKPFDPIQLFKELAQEQQ